MENLIEKRSLGRDLQISAYLNDSPIPLMPGEDGLIGSSYNSGKGAEFSIGDKIKILIVAKNSWPKAVAVLRNQDKNGSYTYDFSEDKTPDDKFASYEKEVELVEGNDGSPNCAWPYNQVQLVLFGAGEIEIWIIALVRQHSNFFLRLQCLHHGFVLKESDDSFKISKEAWNNLLQLLHPQLKKMKKWSDELESTSEPPANFSKRKDKVAFVDHFHEGMGTGWAMLPDGRMAKIHWSSINTIGIPERFRTLIAGQLVSYDLLDVGHHKGGAENGRARLELKGVRPTTR